MEASFRDGHLATLTRSRVVSKRAGLRLGRTGANHRDGPMGIMPCAPLSMRYSASMTALPEGALP